MYVCMYVCNNINSLEKKNIYQKFGGGMAPVPPPWLRHCTDTRPTGRQKRVRKVEDGKGKTKVEERGPTLFR